MPETPDVLVYDGGAIKALGEGRYGGYLVRNTTAADPDLTGEYFTKASDLGIEDGDRISIYYHHGADPSIKNKRIGRGTVKFDDVGVWLEAQLSLADEYKAAIDALVAAGKIGFSSGAAAHLVSYSPTGKSLHIDTWPIGEASLTVMPAEPRNVVASVKSLPAPPPLIAEKANDLGTVTINVNVNGPEATLPPDPTKMADAPNPTPAPEPQPDPVPNPPTPPTPPPPGYTQAQVEEIAAKAVKAYAESQRPTTGDVAVDTTGAPAFNQHTSDTARYDSMETADLSMLIELQEAQNAPQGRRSEKNLKATTAWEARKALALRLHGEEGKNHPAAREAMKSVGLTAAKANELNYSTQASYGDEWAGTAWSDSVWDVIRQETAVIEKIPQFEFPQGAESMTIPLTGADPIWYKVPQATSTATVDHGPSATVPPSKLGTDNEVMTLAKLGARTLFTGELDEDSVRPFMSEIRRALAVSGSEYLESVVIDGDTDATASTNINDIAGTPASTDYFLAVNGFRKLALVTNTANSRAGGVLTSSDYLETVKMLGANGANARDMSKVGLIQTAGVMWKALELTDVKTRDVFNGATIESGRLTRIYGYDLIDSQHAHLKGPFRQGGLAQVADGKIDQDTAGDNISGSIIAVRWDQWRIGWRRRMTIETQRIARADTTEIVAMFRFGLLPRDTEASAISYGITV